MKKYICITLKSSGCGACNNMVNSGMYGKIIDRIKTIPEVEVLEIHLQKNGDKIGLPHPEQFNKCVAWYPSIYLFRLDEWERMKSDKTYFPQFHLFNADVSIEAGLPRIKPLSGEERKKQDADSIYRWIMERISFVAKSVSGFISKTPTQALSDFIPTICSQKRYIAKNRK